LKATTEHLVIILSNSFVCADILYDCNARTIVVNTESTAIEGIRISFRPDFVLFACI
jgi:hypothetical protein